MCGIAGIFNSSLSPDELEARLVAMQDAIWHRGPDDEGLFLSPGGGAGLVSTRLAILDLSPAGHQPMTSADGRYTIAFNGEIYNYGALRAELLVNGYSLRSQTDTEVVLALYEQEGPKCLERLDGMFAFAIWDEQERSLFLARDPLGIKPLYFSNAPEGFCFASELRTLLVSGMVEREVSPAGLFGYLTTGSVPEFETLIKHARMLPAGDYLTWRDGEVTPTTYWEVGFEGKNWKAESGTGIGGWESRSPAGGEAGLSNRETWFSGPGAKTEGEIEIPKANGETGENGSKRSKNGDGVTPSGRMTRSQRLIMAAQAAATVRAALEESIDRHLVSDVPVGVFLSGGIDSTILVALASQRTKEPLRTFSISFDDPAFDEGGVAARTAAHFGAKHTDWRLDPGTAKRLLHEFLERSDQPSVDGFNTFCVAKMAHENDLKVVLSGLGGDEVFGGYPSFRRVPFLMRKSRRLLGLTRSLAGMWLKNSRSGRARRIGWFLSGSVDVAGAYECIRGIFTPLEASELLSFYGVRGYEGKKPARKKVPPQPTIGDQVSYLELTRYMRNQLLRDSDVMSMAWSLELRVPFADRKLIETVARIPAKWRLAPGKRILLDAVPEIPEWVRKRPKQGFAFPFRDWIKSEWGDIFARIQKESPVPTRDWYRTWCLFALENFLERLKAESKS